MFRTNSISTTNLQTLQKRNSLRRVLSNASSKSLRKSDSFRRNSRGSRGSFIIRKKQKREIEQLTLGKVYLIVHLCAGEIIKRGLTEPNIFKPLPFKGEKDEVRHLIDCLMKDNRIEFENELSSQKINNIVVSIRMALRNCTFDIISYENYAKFVRDEQECQYDPEEGCFDQFLSYLSRQSKGILIELFDLFALTMENCHINRIHPSRILKSMSIHIFNESRTKDYESFLLAYQDWSRYSNALIHLFLAYIRERACKTELPEKLNLLLHDYVKRRKQCFMNSVVCENGKEVIFEEHVLPDITIPDLDRVIGSIHQDDLMNNNITSITNNKRIMSDLYPEVSEVQDKFNFMFDDERRTAQAEWERLQQVGLDVLSEEALTLFFAYNDQEISLDSVDIERRKSVSNEKRRASQKKKELLLKTSTLHSKIELIDDDWNDFQKKGFRDSIDSSSNMFSLDSTVGPSSSDNGGNSTVVQSNSTSNEVREKDVRDDGHRKHSKEHVFKDLGQTTIDLSEGTHLMVNYDWMGTNLGERVGEWISIEIRSGLIENEKEFISEWKKSLKNTNRIRLFGRISIQISKRLPWSKSSKRKEVRKSLASIYTPPNFQQLIRRLDEDSTMPQQSYLERSDPLYEQTEGSFEENPERYQTQDDREGEEYQYQDDIYIDESLEPQNQSSNRSYQTRSNVVQDYYYPNQDYEEPNHVHFNQEYYPRYPGYNRGNLSLYSSVRRSPTVLSYNTNRNINSSMSKSSQYSGIRGKDLPYPITPQRQNFSSGRNSPRIRNIPRQQSLIFDRQIQTRPHSRKQPYSQYSLQSRSPQYSQYLQPQRQRQQSYQRYPEQPQQIYDNDIIEDAGLTDSIEKIVQGEQPIQQRQRYEINYVDDSHDIIESETIGDDQQFQDYLYSQKFLSNNYI